MQVYHIYLKKVLFSYFQVKYIPFLQFFLKGTHHWTELHFFNALPKLGAQIKHGTLYLNHVTSNTAWIKAYFCQHYYAITWKISQQILHNLSFSLSLL